MKENMGSKASMVRFQREDPTPGATCRLHPELKALFVAPKQDAATRFFRYVKIISSLERCHDNGNPLTAIADVKNITKSEKEWYDEAIAEYNRWYDRFAKTLVTAIHISRRVWH